MHVRAYNYWVSLLEGCDFPSIDDLESNDVEDFAAHSVLLDFTCGRDNPAVPYIGADIRDECGLTDDTRTISDVPPRSLLSRLTDHYMQIIANRAPIGFEAEFVNQREENICYRGILMPFSSDGDAIDFIYGVINWKTVAETSLPEAVAPTASEDAPQQIEEVPELILEEVVETELEEPVAAQAEDAPLPVLNSYHFNWSSLSLYTRRHYSPIAVFVTSVSGPYSTRRVCHFTRSPSPTQCRLCRTQSSFSTSRTAVTSGSGSSGNTARTRIPMCTSLIAMPSMRMTMIVVSAPSSSNVACT